MPVAIAAAERAFELGINLLDTSPLYGRGLSEHRCGTAIRRLPRQDIVVCTKVGRWMDPFHLPSDEASGFIGGQPHRAVVDYSYDGTMRSVEQSLLRLGTDRLDLLLIHDVDVWTHGVDAIEDRFREALADYKVSFRVNQAGRTVSPIRPPLVLAPKETRTITVSVLPDSTGLCGHWSTRVRVFLKFSDNREIVSSLQEVTDLDVLHHARNTPDDDRLLAYLRHPRAEVRAQGIKYLVQSNMDLAAKEALLRHKLEDSEQSIRDQAVEAAGELKLKSFAPDIEKLLAATSVGDSGGSATNYLGQRFLGSNHIRRRRRVCMTKCG